MGRASIKTRNKIRKFPARPQREWYGDTRVATRITVSAGELKLVHSLPSAERQLSLLREMCQQGPVHTGCMSRCADRRQLGSMRYQPAAAERHP